MLKYKINVNNIKLNINKLSYDNITYDNNFIWLSQKHKNVLPTDVISLLRYKNNEIFFNEVQNFEILDKNHIKIPILKDYAIFPTKVSDITGFTDINGIIHDDALCFIFDGTIHNFFDESKYDNIVISENINNNSTYWLSEKRRCPNDWVINNNIFLIKSIGIDEDNKYIFEEKIYNVTHDIYFVDENGEKYTMEDCIVPVLPNGRDNRAVLYWPYDKSNLKHIKIRSIILSNFNNLRFKTIDDRFYFLNEGVLSFRTNIFNSDEQFSEFSIENGHTNINIPFFENFENNMINSEKLDSYITDIIHENINEIVDMEKQIFSPIILDDNSDKILCDNVKSINFNIKLRNRFNSGETEDERSEMDSIIYAWENDDIGTKWNDIETIEGDLMGYAGYTNDDIYYRKKNVKKSFLRLSFYDTKSRATQSLLFYSTIFLNHGELYSKYAKNITYGISNNEDITLLNDNRIIEPLRLNFSIKNSFDKLNSSEGYYLYLFPNLCNGTIPTEIYMKVEFNHAKFGKTIPLILPNTDDGLPKKWYVSKDNGTDGIKELFDDLYIKVNIKYDKNSGKYIWYVPNNLVNDIEKQELNFTLYEPVVNEYQE